MKYFLIIITILILLNILLFAAVWWCDRKCAKEKLQREATQQSHQWPDPLPSHLENFTRDFLDPERYGHAVNEEIRNHARRALGIDQVTMTQTERRIS